MTLWDTAIRKPVTTLLFTAGIMLFGYFAFRNMGVDLFPEVDLPMVTVTAVLPGADPEIMDTAVTDVIEEQINTIAGVKTIRSMSFEGLAQIVVEFVLTKDVDVAAQEVRDKINLAQKDLPRDLDPPVVDKLDIAAQPILWIAVTSTGDYRRMAQYADKVLKPRLQAAPGVGAITLSGFRDREIRVWLDPYALEAYRLTPRDVALAIQAKHVEMPGGRIEQPGKEFVVKVEGEYKSAEEMKDLVVLAQGGAVVRLSDVARVEDGSEDLRSVARFNGVPAIGLAVRKQSGTNTVAVAQAAKAALREARKGVPEGIRVDIASDGSRFIQKSMAGVVFDLFLGAALTAGVVLVFLRNSRMTFISMISIPASIIASFIAMYALGFTINNMTMLAMSLAIGVVIDDAIVVLENIFRHVEHGAEDALEAARKGTAEVGLAVLAASSSIMGVFLPVAFMQGLIGRFFFQFGLSVALAVLISLIVSLTLTPMLCSRLLKHDAGHGLIFRMLESGFRLQDRLFAALLDRALRHRWITLTLALGVFLGGMALIPIAKKGFVTEPDQSQFIVRFEFPTGTSIFKTDEGLRKIEKLVLAQPEVRNTFASAGDTGNINTGVVSVNLVERGNRKAGQTQIMDRVRALVAAAVPEARTAVESASILGSGQRNSELQYIVQGPSVQELDKVTAAIVADMRQDPGFVDVDTDLRLNKPEVKVSIDRNLADELGVDVRAITDNFNILFGGLDAAKFKEGGNRYNVRLRANPESRATPDDLYQIALRSVAGEMIHTPNLLEIREGSGPDSVNRYGRRRAVTLFSNLNNMPLGEALTKVSAIAARHIPKDPGWSTALTGRSQAFAESFLYLLYAVAIAIVVIYIILGSQFESFIHPFTIMMSVPLAILGGLGLIVVTGKNLDIFAFIGFIMLIGIVTKNAILLVDFTNQARAGGMERGAALRLAGARRLRPILMTSFTAMASVLPVALALSEGGEQRAPMGIAVFGGLFTSTFLTLVVIPCVYSVMDDLSFWIRKLFGAEAKVKHSAAESAESNPVEAK